MIGIALHFLGGHQGVTEGSFICTGGEAQPKEKVPERRLWLHGSMAASPGTCGLYRTARTEPMGERLRLLFNGEPIINPAHGNKHDPAGLVLSVLLPVL